MSATSTPLPLSADWFRTLAETTATAIFVYDEDRFLYVNPACEELTGYPESDLLEMGPDDLVHPDHLSMVRERRAARLRGDGTPERYEMMLQHRSGETRWVLFTAGLLHWAGRATGMGTAVDITERKRAEGALERQIELEQALVEISRHFVHLPSAQLEEGIDWAVSRLGRMLEVDRAQLFRFTGEGGVKPSAEWRAEGVPPGTFSGHDFPADRFPWGTAKLRRHELVTVGRLEDLPPEASAERELFSSVGIRATVVVPVHAGENLLGFLAFDSLSRERRWEEQALAILGVAAEVLASALERQHGELALRQSQKRLELAQQAGRSIVWEWEVGSDAMQMSSFAMTLFGARVDQVPRTGADLRQYIPEEDREAVSLALRRALASGEPYIVEHRVVTPTGETRWLAVRGQLFPGASEGRQRIVGVSVDITEHKLAEEALYQEQERAQVTLASIGDGVIRTDAAGRVDYLNPVAESLTGLSARQALGRPLPEVYQVVDEATRKPRPDPVERCLREQRIVVLPGHSLLIRRDGAESSVRDSAAPVLDRHGKLRGAVLVFQDVTQLRGLEREMTYLARHDSLTGLINRREFERQLQGALASAGDGGRHHAFCYLDLDEFKLVNDTCGHVAGDELLRQLTALLASQVRESDVLARLGGDEFGVLLVDCSMDNARAVAEKLCLTVRQFRFHWQDRVFDVGVSIGLVPLTPESGSLAGVFSAGDAACYVAKELGRNRVHLYQPDDHAVAKRYGEMQWVQRINHAFEDGRFRLFRQPILPLAAAGPEMAEILLRMVDEEGELLSTPSFIAAAERYHLIGAIDRWVVETALGAVASEERVHTINLSGHSLGDPAFLDFVMAQIRSSGVSPQRLCFEITETATIASLARARTFIASLRELGCRFVLDDFGTGLSSFAYLQTLPVDFLKIDGEFVRQMAGDPVQRALVTSIHQIGHLMGLATIAESVESAEALKALEEIGVDYAQGFLLGRPEPL